MHGKEIIIIGGGLGGLAVGAYLQINGYKTRILEMANQSGGICVTWKRGDYIFDGATNYLPGSSPKSNIHPIISEILDFKDLDIYDYDEFIRIEHKGETFRVYTDADKLEQEMLRIAPEDKKPIREFIGAAKKFGAYDLPFEKAPELLSPFELLPFALKNMGLFLFRLKYGGMSVKKFAQKFKNPLMREMFQQIFPHHAHFAVMAPMAPIGWMHHNVAGYPRGGSKKIISMMEKKYLDLGGTIEFFHRVTKVLVQDDTAVGVLCDNGKQYDAARVISSVSTYNALYHLLEGKFLSSAIKRNYSSIPAFTALVQVSLGIARTFEGEAEKSNLPLSTPIQLGEETMHDMMVRICSFDPMFAPPGKTAVIVQLRTHDYQYWYDLREKDPTRYKKEKDRVANEVIAALDTRFGSIREKVEVIDVATPATYLRYNDLWKGAHQGWSPVPGVIGKPMKKKIPGLERFYLTGQWISPAGGIPAVIAMGRQVTQIICAEDKKAFRPS